MKNMHSTSFGKNLRYTFTFITGVIAINFLVIKEVNSEPVEQGIPVESFAQLPDVSNVKLSPNGKRVASLIRIDLKDKKGTGINLYDVGTGKQTLPLYVDNKKFVITGISWGNDDQLLVKAKFPAVRFGKPTTETRLYILDIQTNKVRNAIPKSLSRRLNYSPQIQSNVVDYLPEEPNYVLLQMSGISYEGEPEIYKLSLDPSKLTTKLQPHRKGIIDWVLDTQHQVRVGIAREKTQYKIYQLQENSKEMKTLWQFEAFSKDEVWPMGFDTNPDILFVKALHNGKDAIFSVDLSTKSLEKKLIYADENYDVTGSLRRDPKSQKVVGVGSHFWEKKFKDIQYGVDEAIKQNSNYLLNFSLDSNQYISLSTADTEPGLYLLGNIQKNTLTPIAYRYSALSPEKLSEKKPIEYKARDGLAIEGFLTLPKDKKRKDLPTIIFPHGGPISYDNDGFDYWTQFLASRGYAVFQMNFRGSYGYGFDFMKQGLRGWGQAMQDDVEDGTRWLIKEGISDPNKICILGASYGGYAALMGVIKTPELYQCAVSFAGVTDLEFLVRMSRGYNNYEIIKKQIGEDYKKLWEYSPLKHADKINVPVLLMHGSKDRVVRAQHSDEMNDELADLNKEVEYLVLEDGDHYLSNSEHRLQAFKYIERFLSEQLK